MSYRRTATPREFAPVREAHKASQAELENFPHCSIEENGVQVLRSTYGDNCLLVKCAGTVYNVESYPNKYYKLPNTTSRS
jgi:cytochrome b involved in lipid metabolism